MRPGRQPDDHLVPKSVRRTPLFLLPALDGESRLGRSSASGRSIAQPTACRPGHVVSPSDQLSDQPKQTTCRTHRDEACPGLACRTLAWAAWESWSLPRNGAHTQGRQHHHRGGVIRGTPPAASTWNTLLRLLRNRPPSEGRFHAAMLLQKLMAERPADLPVRRLAEQLPAMRRSDRSPT